MTNLLKYIGKEQKIPSFPAITEKDDFKTAFFKLARYLGKLEGEDAMKDALGCINNLEVLNPEFDMSHYDAYDLNSLYLDDEAERTARTVLEGRGKVDTKEQPVLVFTTDNSSERIFAVAPTCSSTNDGARFSMKYYSSYSSIRIYSIGYLLLASRLESAVKGKIPEGIHSIFEYNAKSWRFYKYIGVYTEALLDIIGEEYNVNLNLKYSKEGRDTIATFRTDKKYQDEELNKSTIFNQWFRKVEVDTEKYNGYVFDYEKFSEVEKDFAAIYDQLPKTLAKPELRFRKLGKHKAYGLYSPFSNIIAVDVRMTNSFVHEYGHYLDFKYQKNVISSSLPFAPFVKMYRENLKTLNETSCVNKKRLDYFNIPTEIFARGFELWVHANIVSSSSVIQQSDCYNNNIEYKAFEGFKESLFAYFNIIFKQQICTSQNSDVAASKVNEVETVYEQLSLF